MAMPASGCIGIITCPNSVACSSIAQAVDGNVTPPKSLCALSVSAGKTAPHGMAEFYSYVPSATPLCLVTQTTCSSLNLSYCSACLCGLATVGDCACVCIDYSVEANEGKTSARACILCNSTPIVACTVTQGDAYIDMYEFVARQGDSIIFCAYASDFLGDSFAYSYLSISDVTGIVGSYCKGTPFEISAMAGMLL